MVKQRFHGFFPGMGLAIATGLGLWAAPAIADGMPGGVPLQSTPQSGETAPAANAEAYTRAMQIGYDATERGDYQTALINFRRALEARPGDRYARDAIANVESYLARQRREAEIRAYLGTLRTRLTEAVESRDWACAASTVDELITYTPPNSLARSELVVYRGEITGFLDARDSLEQWSTVCSADFLAG